MKLWYYPRMFRQLSENDMKAAFRSVEIPDAEGKKRLCENNEIISYEYAKYLERILGIRNTKDTEKRANAATMDSASPDSPQSGGASENEGTDSKFF